jgi:hypothetical protein
MGPFNHTARQASLFLLPLALLLLNTVANVRAHPEYLQELPNLPIVDGAVWRGVGHFARDGGGKRNAFGQMRGAYTLLFPRCICISPF